jgi:hypothetical protein
MAIKKFSTKAKVNSVQNSLFASGGDEVTTVGVYKYHVFTTVGPNSFTVFDGTKSVDVMMCGGGGSGGYRIGGGGGGGELKTFTAVSISPGTYTVVVGHAGSASGVGLKNNGGMSKLLLGQTSLLTALGGGAGGAQASGDGNTGGSGGGADEWSLGGTSRGGLASGTNTNAGGDSRTNPYAGGGGGGATSAGIPSTNLGGAGGGGGQGFTLTNIDSNFSSANFNAFTGMTHICSGGGGGGYTAVGGAGGTGGGQGGGTGLVGQAATSFGSGGGAGGNDSFPQYGSGFKGLVVIRYTLN